MKIIRIAIDSAEDERELCRRLWGTDKRPSPIDQQPVVRFVPPAREVGNGFVREDDVSAAVQHGVAAALVEITSKVQQAHRQ